jgi:hypothetical protein
MSAAELIEVEPTAARSIAMRPEPAAPVVQTPMALLTHAVQNGASVETMEKLMALHERYEANQARRAFDQAVSAAKAEIQPAIRNRKGHTDRQYADFAAIAAAVDPVIGQHGLSYRFRTKQEGAISVTCILSHRDGHSEENTLTGPADTSGSKNAIQAIGSTMSYLMRYSLVQALGLSTVEDDDGRAAAATVKADTISEDQIAELQAMIDDLGGAEPAKFKAQFLRWAGVESLADIPAKNFRDAVAGLQNRRKA